MLRTLIALLAFASLPALADGIEIGKPSVMTNLVPAATVEK